MKKLTVLFAAVLCAAMSFADCNEYGWTNKGEMFLELQSEINDSLVAHSKYALAVVKEENDSIFYMAGGTWKYWEDVEAANTPVENANGDFAASTYNKQDEIYSILRTDKWQWLLDYIKANYKEGREDHADFDETYAILIRCNIQAFFFNSPTFKGGDQNPWSFDYTEAGKYSNWQSAWGKTFCIKEICNPDGWKNKGEMFLGMQADYNAANSENLACAKDSDGLVYYNIDGTWTYWEDAEAQHLSMSTPSFFQAATYGKASFIDWLNGDGAAKWGWLKTYIETVAMADFAWDAAVWRAAISGFFLLSPANPTYPKTADFATFGQYVNWQSAWGQTFCTGGMAHVDYVLPEGAVTNDYGWTSGEDMYQALAADVYAAKNDGGLAFTFAGDFTGTFGKADPAGATGIAHDIVTFDLTFFTTEPYASKWGWLTQYMDSINANFAGALKTSAATSGNAPMRYALAAFFANSQAMSWPYSGDFTGRGADAPAAYMSTWKHALANPTDFAPDYVAPLNAPFKEGETFRGWFLDEIGATEAVDTLSAALTGMTLYGLFGQYVSTIAEVVAQEDNTDAYTGGVVTFISGKNIYIQDITGGLLIYAKETPTCTVGQKITVSGKKVLYGGAPEVSNAVIEKVEKGTMPEALVLQMNDIVAGGLKYFGQLVRVNDIRIAKYDDKGNNPFVVSGADTLQCYKMVIDQTEFPVGQRVNLTAIVGYYNAVQFVGDIAGFEKIIYQGEKDPNTYEDLVFIDEDGDGGEAGATYTYKIENNWLISAKLGNWDKNKPNQVAEQCRGMAVKDGIIYITYRASNTPNRGELKLLRYDAETGEKLADLPLKDYVFCEPAADTTGTRCVMDEETGISYLAEGYEWNYDEFTSNPIFGPNTDMHVDYDGNILVANLPTEGHVFQIWKLTADDQGVLDGGGELVLYVGGNSGITDFATRYPDDAAIRLDRFDLAGSVDGDAWIFAPSQNSNIVYEMDIVGGKWDGECWNHVCQNGEVAFSYSPRIAVVDGGEAFYVDGFATHPALFANDGTMLENFAGIVDDEGEEVNPSAMGLLQNDEGVAPATGECGVHEFPCGGAYFLAMGAGSYEGAYQPYGTHLVFRFKNDNRHFYEMQRAWELSKDGFGNNKNAQFNYMQCHIEKDDLTTELYLFVAENGIGKYTITADKYFGEQETGLEAVKASVKNGDVKKVMMNGRMYIIRDGKAFSAMGQKF